MHVQLESGLAGLLRPIEPSDRADVERLYGELSERSRRHRFWSAPPRLSTFLLDKLTNADGVDHVAWCFLGDDDPQAVGGASFWRFPDEPDAAEFAVTVMDDAQRHGIGTLLLAKLWLEARARGIARFRAVALLENTRLANWMRAVGATVEAAANQWEVELPLDPERSFQTRLASSRSARRLEYWLAALCDGAR